jgi:hypothetical protein
MEGNSTIFPYELTEHSKKRLSEREIPLEWIERVLFSPQRTEPDPIDPTAVWAFAAIPEAGDRVLKVVYNFTTNPCRVITFHFERRLRGKL